MSKDQTFYTVNDLNQLTHQNDQNYKYDSDGNLLQDTERLFSYDALGRLTEIKKGEDATQYSYDGFHRRMSKIHKGEETNFFYQGDNEIGAYKHDKLIQFRVLGLTRGLEIGASVALELNDKVYTPIHDAFGNIVTLVHHLQPVETYRYTAFGEMGSLPSLENPWRFSSKRFDEESGLYYFGRRYYQPDIGRWITPDPAGFAEGFNLYNYVNNNPLRYIDPDGRLPFYIVPLALYALEFSLPYVVPLVTEYTGSAFLGALVAATVQGLNGTGSIDPTVLLSGDIPSIVHQGCLVYSVFGSSVKTIATSGMNYARNQLIGSVVDKSTKKAFNWCSQKLTRQTINKVSKDTNKVAERILLKDGVSGARAESFYKNANFIVGSEGVVIPTSRNILESGFKDANFKSFPTRSPGMSYVMPNGNLTRIMEPSGKAPLRASFTNFNDGAINPFSGKPIQPPKGLIGSQRRQYVREYSHLELMP